jgi:hypothetical protein
MTNDPECNPAIVASDGRVACATMLWRFRERLEMTVVLKAIFALVPSGVATFVRPGVIYADDQPFAGNPARSVQFASDLVPYRARCDVTFVGHAYSPQVRAESAMPIRLGIFRETQTLLDKSLRVLGPRKGAGGTPEPFWRMEVSYERARGAAGQLNPVGNDAPNIIDPAEPARPGCFGPISRYWPARKGLIHGVEKAAFEGTIWSLPDPMPWGYFQAAPAEQQIEPLKGGELLVLEGLHPTQRELVTRLPSERAAARAILARPGEALVEHDIPLLCDTLSIDGDAQQFALTWRGHFEVHGGEPALRFIGIAAELCSPGQPAAGEHAPTDVALHTSPSQARSDEPLGSATVGHAPVDRARAALVPAMPFEYRPPRASPTASDATPWGGGPLRPVPAPTPGEATITVSNAVEIGGSTVGLGAHQHAEAAAKRPLPFAAGDSEHAVKMKVGSHLGLPFEGPPLEPVPPMQMVEDETHSIPLADVAPVALTEGAQWPSCEPMHDLDVRPEDVAELLAALAPTSRDRTR